MERISLKGKMSLTSKAEKGLIKRKNWHFLKGQLVAVFLTVHTGVCYIILQSVAKMCHTCSTTAVCDHAHDTRLVVADCSSGGP